MAGHTTRELILAVVAILGAAWGVASAIAQTDIDRIDSRVESVEARQGRADAQRVSDIARIERWLVRIEGKVDRLLLEAD